MRKFTGRDVLQRAIDIITARELTDSCSSYCPWCAIAAAKGELDDEHGTGLRGLDNLRYYYDELQSDAPLIEARVMMKQWNDTNPATCTREAALTIMTEAVRRLG